MESPGIYFITGVWCDNFYCCAICNTDCPVASEMEVENQSQNDECKCGHDSDYGRVVCMGSFVCSGGAE